MLKHLAAVGASALAMGTAACGDDEGGDSEGGGDDFVSQLNTICEDSTSDVVAANLDLGYETDPKDQAELGERILEIRKQVLSDYEALEPSEDDAAAFDDLIAAREDLIAAAEERIAATESGDEAAVEEAVEAGEKAGEAEDEAAAELGADICDDELPEEDADAAVAAFEEFVTKTDPATSCDSESGVVTEPFLEANFGDPEKCAKEQEVIEEKGGIVAESIDVSKVTGVDGLAATVTLTEVGGKFDGDEEEATMYYLDGGWKVFSVRPIE